MNISENLDEKIEKAVELFKAGYNCSQAVFTAFAGLYGLDRETSLRISASFGGGIGRMRQTCGAACGMFLLAGLENGATDASDQTGKGNNYKLVQELAKQFKEKNGSIICAELLGLTNKEHTETNPDQRTPEYYKKRPCTEMVREAATIYAEFLKTKYTDKQ